MPSDYNLIRAENIKEYGEGTRHLEFLGRLYTDKTHFIFELLQNAEDAKATKVSFDLYDDSLRVYHNGRFFNEKDVRGICGVGEGTKTDDLSQIGKFGIGFKSVYAYTRTPEIHSDNEHFLIEHYVRPFQAEKRKSGEIDRKGSTLLIFPFDNPDVKKEKAYKEISNRLKRLTPRTLLFLKNIVEICWSVCGNTKGVLRRSSPTVADIARKVTVESSFPKGNGVPIKEDWLVLERPVSLPHKEGIVSVEIAFLLDLQEDNQYTIVPLNDAPLVVYFPTEKYTRLGFLIQGPYRTTPSRDNIPKNDDWNSFLISETIELIKEAFFKLRESGDLNIRVLEAMPIRPLDFSEESMFRSIFNAVRIFLRQEEMLPATGGTYISANKARLADSSYLRDLISGKQLTELCGSSDDLKWVTGDVSENKTPDLWRYFRDQLDIKELRPETLVTFDINYFLRNQTDEWMIRFYHFLSERSAMWRAKENVRPEGPFRSKAIIRLSDGNHVQPFRHDDVPNAYLGPLATSDIPCVKEQILQDPLCEKFLKTLGLKEPDVFDEVINCILPKYSDDKNRSLVTLDENVKDIKKILMAKKTDYSSRQKKLKEEIDGLAYISTTNLQDKPQFKDPGNVYFRNSILLRYFDDGSYEHFLDCRYDDSLLNFKEDDWKVLGVQTKPFRIEFKPNLTPEKLFDLRGQEGETYQISLSDFRLNGLKKFLSRFSTTTDIGEKIDLARLLWNMLAESADEYGKLFFSGYYKWFYRKEKSKHFTAKFCRQLIEAKWLPGAEDKFYRPQDILQSEIHEGFQECEKLVEVLGVGSEAIKKQTEYETKSKLAKRLGVTFDDIQLLKDHPDAFEKWKVSLSVIEEGNGLEDESGAAYSDRRAAKIAQEAIEAEEVKRETKKRRERVSKINARQWLEGQYTNHEGKIFCQICRHEMPFKKPTPDNDKYYFECVELFKGLKKESERLHLALCPLCAAKYKVFIKNRAEQSEIVRKTIMEGRDRTIPIALETVGYTINFGVKHYNDLKIFLENIYREGKEQKDRKAVKEENNFNSTTSPIIQEKLTEPQEAIESGSAEAFTAKPVVLPKVILRKGQTNCPECGVVVNLKNMSKHRQKAHSDVPKVKNKKPVSKKTTPKIKNKKPVFLPKVILRKGQTN
ncbi:MAG: hypothetical protein RBR67_18260 [Desulfobacterium sp.]|nr:hypothetical protein [Desulfobacterium sp.]